MRTFIVMAMFAASLTSAAWKQHTELRDFQLAATHGITGFEVDAGHGHPQINAAPGARNSVVTVTIRAPEEDADRAQQIIAADTQLTPDKTVITPSPKPISRE